MFKLILKRKKTFIVILLIVCFICYKFFTRGVKIKEQDFITTTVTKGDVTYVITASGTIQPLNTVDVGTQVSGLIEKVFVDYNDEVKEGQLLAQLDVSTLKETVNNAKANLDIANAELKLSKTNFDRIQKLYKEKLTSKNSFEEQEVNYSIKKANSVIAQASYNIAKKNYDYAFITSPISGTIISKNVEEGQTVASSYSTPTLFKIAEDLSKMQIWAYVAEADIGVIKEGMSAQFTVDAYPTIVFNGTIKQIRLSPVTDSNVVMYTVIIDTDNKDKKLLPGMTASVSIVAQQSKDVLRLSTMALQFKPKGIIKNIIDKKTFSHLKDNQEIVYMFKNKKLQPVIITKGLTDMNYIEITDGLQKGDKIVTQFLGNGTR